MEIYSSDSGETVSMLDFMDNKVLKIPSSPIGHIECEYEVFVYSMSLPKYRQHLAPILEKQGSILIVPKISSLIKLYKEKSLEADEMQKHIQSMKEVAKYLEERFDLNPKLLLVGSNIGFYNKKLVFIHYGYKKEIL